MNSWSLPKFTLRWLLAEEARLQDALFQSFAVWDGKAAQDVVDDVTNQLPTD